MLNWCISLYPFGFIGSLSQHIALFLQIEEGYTETLGIRYIKSMGGLTRGYWFWISIGALIGYTILFNILFTLSLTYLDRKLLYLLTVGQLCIPDCVLHPLHPIHPEVFVLDVVVENFVVHFLQLNAIW